MPLNSDLIEWVTFDIFPQYAVNNMGDVFNMRLLSYLKPSMNLKGYMRVGLMVYGKQRFVYVHRLVAMAFLPDYRDGYEILFIDGNKRNCQATNLMMGPKRTRKTRDGLW